MGASQYADQAAAAITGPTDQQLIELGADVLKPSDAVFKPTDEDRLAAGRAAWAGVNKIRAEIAAKQ